MRPSTTTACRQCGAALVSGARFCLSCGSPVTAGLTGAPGTVPTSAGTLAGHPSMGARLTDADRQAQLSQLLTLATLGEFEILCELGRGGMATVFLAHDLSLDRQVAIKVIAPGLLTAPGAVERFKREARTAGALSHPHIIPIHSVRETDQLLYFVMKFVEGRPLDDIIREQGRLPIRMVQAILTEVGQALAYAHRRGVVHRDIKPANIMLDGEGWAVVTDFGIAKVLEGDSLTVSGSMVGTPYYMSPEQCAGKPVTGASDQYSLGVVAYEMLTGHPPFSGDTIMEIMKGHFFEVPEPIADARSDTPPGLAEALTRMLSKEAEQRWTSMDEAVAAMDAVPLAQDDPVRSEMIALARSSESLRRISRLSIPVSPLPAAWTRARPLTSSHPKAGQTEELPSIDNSAEPPDGRGAMGWLKVAAAIVMLAGAGAGAALVLRPAAGGAPASSGAPADPTAIVAEPPAAGVDSGVPLDTTPAPAITLPTPAEVVSAQVPTGPSATELAARRELDAAAYADRLQEKLQPLWRAKDPGSYEATADDRVVWRLVIGADGDQKDGELLSGTDALQDQVMELLNSAAPYEVLPPSIRREPLRLNITFTGRGLWVRLP
ncbi:MAG: protein kinase [Gemmatimonadota bacterium]|nr:protein kinase [Gemmatimonadota bacterium]